MPHKLSNISLNSNPVSKRKIGNKNKQVFNLNRKHKTDDIARWLYMYKSILDSFLRLQQII